MFLIPLTEKFSGSKIILNMDTVRYFKECEPIEGEDTNSFLVFDNSDMIRVVETNAKIIELLMAATHKPE